LELYRQKTGGEVPREFDLEFEGNESTGGEAAAAALPEMIGD
jgi:hypothetical protein